MYTTLVGGAQYHGFVSSEIYGQMMYIYTYIFIFEFMYVHYIARRSTT